MSKNVSREGEGLQKQSRGRKPTRKRGGDKPDQTLIIRGRKEPAAALNKAFFHG